MSKAPMSVDTQIVLEEWKNLKDEIKKRVEQRTTLTELMITLDSALITAASAEAFLKNNYIIFGIIPFVTAFFMLLIKASYNRHRLLTRYIIEEIEGKKLKNITSLGFQSLNFETWFEEQTDEDAQYVRTNRAHAYSVFNAGVFIVCSSIFIHYVWFVCNPAQIGLPFMLHPDLRVLLLYFYILFSIVVFCKSRIKREDIQD